MSKEQGLMNKDLLLLPPIYKCNTILKNILKKPLNKLPLYPEMNEFDQTSILACKNGFIVKYFHSFLSSIQSSLKGERVLTSNSYCNSND